MERAQKQGNNGLKSKGVFQMKNTVKILLAALAIALVLGMTVGCKEDGAPKPNTDPKEIKITGISEEARTVFNANTSRGALLALITSDRTPVAWCYYDKPIIADMTFNLFDGSDHRWTGTYDVAMMAFDEDYNEIYTNVWSAPAVNITAKSTTVEFSSFNVFAP
jgi:hypothetical protein